MRKTKGILYQTNMFCNQYGTLARILLAASNALVLFLSLICRASDGRCSEPMSPETLSEKLKTKADVTLVDVRNIREFEKSHIPASLNIPLFAVKTKPYLKSGPVVLVSEGISYKGLLDEVEVLKGLGYDVSLLDGGFYEWRREGKEIEGTAIGRGLPVITVQAFLSGRNFENWTVVDARQPGKSVVEDKALAHVQLALRNDPKRFTEQLSSIVSKRKEKNFFTVVLCDEIGTRYDEIERHVQAAGIRNVVYLEGGYKAYRTVVQGQLSGTQTKSPTKSGKEANRTCTSGCR